jgi:hypothetical protein
LDTGRIECGLDSAEPIVIVSEAHDLSDCSADVVILG